MLVAKVAVILLAVTLIWKSHLMLKLRNAVLKYPKYFGGKNYPYMFTMNHSHRTELVYRRVI